MAIDPKLVSIKTAGELPVSDPSENANFLFYEGETLQRSPMSNIYDKVSSGLLPATTTTVPEATGFHRYLVHEAGTYTNFSGIVVTAADLDVVNGVANNEVILEVNNGVASKKVRRLKGDSGAAGQNKINTWVAGTYATGQQVIYEGKIYESNAATVAGDVPSISTKWVEKLGSKLIQTKNLFKGLRKFASINDTAINGSGIEGRIILEPIPVEQGKYYTLSGLLISFTADRVVGVNTTAVPSVVQQLFTNYGADGRVTIYIDNPNVTFITAQVSNSDSTKDTAYLLKIQVEEGQNVTNYIAPKIIETGDLILESSKIYTDSKAAEAQTNISKFNIDRISEFTKGENVTNRKSAYGWNYRTSADETIENFKGQSMAVTRNIKAGVKNVFSAIQNVNKLGAAVPKDTNAYPFTIPSGIFDNSPNNITAAYLDLSDYVHPSVAYSSTAIGGYKYWMVASAYPALSAEDNVTTEDEDLFVTNTPEEPSSWKRVRSLYETDKTYTTTTLRLPPVPVTWSANSRRNAFLPVPKGGTTIEISNPAHNGYGERNNATVTLDTTNLQFKHDPAICIHGGFIYVLHTFHLYYSGEGANQHKFLVLTRSADGVNWESIRRDGTTYPLNSEAALEKLFSKDSVSEKYNYWHYMYKTAWSNPEFVIYGASDVELIYGYNHSRRFAGTTPFNINLEVELPVQDLGSGNHPGVAYIGGKLIYIHTDGVYYSTNRGVSFTKYAKNPRWYGGDYDISYKKAICEGEAGKIILFEAFRFGYNNPTLTVDNQERGEARFHKMVYTVYPSFTKFESLANTGFATGYVDFMIIMVNYATQSKRTYFFPNLGISSATALGRARKIKAGEITVNDGDIAYIYITTSSRNGGLGAFSEIMFEDKA